MSSVSPAAHGSRQVGVILGRTQAKGGGGNRGNHKRSSAGGNLPKRDRPLFLNFRMRREILEGQDVVVRKRDDGVGIGCPGQLAKGLQHGNHFIGGTIIRDHDNERTRSRLLQQDQKQGFCGGNQSGDTNPPRALLEMGGHTRKGR